MDYARGTKLKVLGALAHIGAFQDVVRMLYYVTGMATERSAVLAYNLLHDGVREMGESAIADTVIAPIKRQEPGHYAFYQLSARGLWAELAGWQQQLDALVRAYAAGEMRHCPRRGLERDPSALEALFLVDGLPEDEEEDA
ncbi:MAG: hypothetical protein ACPHCJ_09405 [Oceanococcaceae bacterium]